MAQTVATLMFLLVAGASVTVIAASLIDDWALVMRVLGFDRNAQAAPLPPPVRAVAHQPVVIRFKRPLNEMRVAA